MLGFSGRTGRGTFAVVGTVCFFSSALMLAAKPGIEVLRMLDATTAVIVGNLMALAALVWTMGAAFAWLLFSVRRLRDAGWSPFLAVISVGLGFVNDPRVLVDPSAWSEKPVALILTLMGLAWLIVLIALPSRGRVEAEPEAVATPVRRAPGPVAPRKQFGLR